MTTGVGRLFKNCPPDGFPEANKSWLAELEQYLDQIHREVIEEEGNPGLFTEQAGDGVLSGRDRTMDEDDAPILSVSELPATATGWCKPRCGDCDRPWQP